jgi:hypothetical protein
VRASPILLEPHSGIAGGGVALLLFYAAGSAVLASYILSGRNLARLRWCRLRWSLFRDILRVGAISVEQRPKQPSRASMIRIFGHAMRSNQMHLWCDLGAD